MAGQEETAGAAPPSPEVQALLAEISAQGTAVRDLKAQLKEGKVEQAAVDTAVRKLLELKAKLPPEFQEKKSASKVSSLNSYCCCLRDSD